MKIVVPLAGPGFETPGGLTKAEHVVEGQPLLRYALESRPWWRSGTTTDDDLVFVLRDDRSSRRLAVGPLHQWYPRAKTVFISSYTRGAALSALAGLAMAGVIEEPVCVDLADIIYEVATLDRVEFRSSVGGIALVFESSNAAYSYLRTDLAGRVTEAAEKRVISRNASAGTYLFRSVPVVLKAIAHNLEHAQDVMHNELFFICPLFNGILAQGLDVELVPVDQVRDIKFAAQ